MLKIAKMLAFCSFALFCANAAAQDIPQESEEPSGISVSDNNASESANNSNSPETADSSVAENSAPVVDDAGAAVPEDSSADNAEKSSENDTGANDQILTDALLDKQLREVSTNLDTLKEDTFTTKSRLLLLREEVLQRSVSGSRLQIRHKNDMGGQYELVQIYYAIDRSPVFNKQDNSGDLDDLDDEVIYDHLVAPGAHQLNVLYIYKGKKWGIFTYMSEYTFRVESGYDFNIDEGKAAELIITANEQGGAFTPYEERPSVKFDFQQYDMIAGSVPDLDAADNNTGETP